MKVLELPISLWPGREPALGIVAERESVVGKGFNVYLGNGQVPNAAITGCVVTLEGLCDDSLAIFINGLPLKDDEILFGADDLVFDLFALAATAGLTLNTGDLVELFTKDVLVGLWQMHPWSAVLTFADATEQTITGGEYQNSDSDYAPHYRAMGSFTLGAAPSRQATSYQLLGILNWHATRGLLLADYAADSPVIDGDGLLVTFPGVDWQVNANTEFNAHANDLLVLINDELFSVAGVTLVAARTYRLAVFRARLGTNKGGHLAGFEVFIFTRDALFIFSHPAIQPGNQIALKIGLIGGGLTGDAEQADPVGFSVNGSRIVPPISNLAVDGEIVAALRAVGDDFAVAWSLPDLLDIPRGWTFQTRLQIIVDGSVVLEVLSATETATILATEIDPLLTSGDFTLRACLEATSSGQILRSEYTDLTVSEP